MHALERNFNGVNKEKFSNTCASFLAKFIDKSRIAETLEKFSRHPMNVLQDALSEVHPKDSSQYTLPRYKMIIDNTNDDSVMRLLQVSGILNSTHSFYKLSSLEEGADIERLKLVSRVKFAAQQGNKTVVMSQIEEVSECFYDLFNHHFKEFRKEGRVSYYANIAIGGISRPCIIHPSFQCIVHVQSNQLDEIPAPYLNRFEKYQLNIDDILAWQISRLPVGIGVLLSNILSECEEFLKQMGNWSLWSSSPNDTLKSIFVRMIPPAIGSCVCELRQAEQSISSIVLCFIKHWFAIDIADDTIYQAITIASRETVGISGIELRKVLEMEGCFNQSQYEQIFEDLASGRQDSALSRSIATVVHYTILRYAIIQLLQVAVPEAVFLQK